MIVESYVYKMLGSTLTLIRRFRQLVHPLLGLPQKTMTAQGALRQQYNGRAVASLLG